MAGPKWSGESAAPYFEGCNCDAICPCRAVRGVPGGPSTHGVCYGSLSWHILEGHHGPVDLTDLKVVLSLRYHDEVQPSTPWEVVLYVDDRAEPCSMTLWLRSSSARRGHGRPVCRAGHRAGPRHPVRTITVEHVEARKRIDVAGYLTVEAEGAASGAGEVQGIPGFDHPGTELYGDVLTSTDEVLRWELRGGRRASFATDFDYSSSA